MSPLSLLSIALLILVVLTACGEDTEQRRFATDKQPSFVAASPSVGPTATARPIPTNPLPALSPAALIPKSGGAATVYVIRDSDLWAINAGNQVIMPVVAGMVAQPVVTAANVDGTRVAILGEMTGQSEGTTLLVMEGGLVRLRIDRIEETFDKVGPELVPVSLDWSADGQRLLAGFRGGGLLDIQPDGEVSVLLSVKQVPLLVSALWSPSGDAVAYIADDGTTGAGRLFVAKLRGGATDPVLIAPARGMTGQSVESLSWRPDAGTILYLQSSAASDIEGQDLFEISPNGQDRRLIASAGRVAPVAGIREFAISPDGKSVAYSVYVPGANGGRFDSLWIRAIDSVTLVEIPLGQETVVTAFWWTASGLLLQTQSTAPDATPAPEVSVAVVGRDLVPRPITLHDATPEASPESSPVSATPAA